MKYRIIVQSTENGESEYVAFYEEDSDEFNSPIEDLLYPGHTVDSDEVCEIDLPSGFPTNYSLKRQ